MKIKHKLALLLGIMLLIIAAGTVFYLASVPSGYRKIEIGTAYRKNLTQSITEEGVVEPVRKQAIGIDGEREILEVLVKEGQHVKKGDLLLRLAASDNDKELAVEEINLKLAERELATAIKDRKAELLDVEYAFRQAEIELASAKSELEKAQKTLASDKVLYESGAISKSMYEEAVEDEQSKKNEYILKEMERDKAMQAIESFDTDKEGQLSRLWGNIDILKESIKNLQAKVDADSRADIDGKVVRLDIDQEILVYDVSQYIVNLKLRQQDALYIEKDMTARIKVKGMEEKEYKGTVLTVEDVADTAESGGDSPRVNVKIKLEDPDESIRLGYKVEVKIDLNIKNEAVVVDYESIVQDSDGKKFVYYVKNDVARRVAVTTGIETDYEVEILEGIIQGDRYVVNPPEKMQDRNSVKIWGWRYESK
ncbi:MAG TPA: biotin/lipoyl-binding protein [Clostridia bacterium]|nr:biotin/lipoyl-binding protein [Clostridia bacterium]